MPCHPHLNGPPAAIDVWLAAPEARSRFDASSLCAAERAAWSAIRSERRRRDFEVSRALAGEVAPDADTRCSQTHSHGYAALAAARHVAVGVDLERCVPRDGASLAATAFSAREVGFVAGQAGDEARALAFYDLWVLKEACAKALGRPLVEVLGGTDFSPWLRGASPTVPGPAEADPWSAWLFAPRPDLRLAVFAAGATGALEEPRLHEWPGAMPRPWRPLHRLAGAGADLWTRPS